MGVLSMLTMLEKICNTHLITSGKTTLGLDGKHAFEASGASHFDLLSEIHRCRDALPMDIAWYWIRGHQDDHANYSDLDCWAQDSVLAYSRKRSGQQSHPS